MVVNGKSIAYKKEEMQTEFAIQSEAELLYFTLFSLKSDLNYDLLGLVSGMNGSNAKRNQATDIEVLNYDEILGVYAGLWNFYLSLNHCINGATSLVKKT